MSLKSDIQSKLAMILLADVTLTAGTVTDEASASIDTKEFDAIVLGLSLNRALAGSDAVTYKFQQSDNGSTGWTDVPADGNLPYSAEGAIVGNNSPYIQTVGCFSSDRYVRVVFNGVVDTDDLVISIAVALEDRHRESDRYIDGGLPTDGQP